MVTWAEAGEVIKAIAPVFTAGAAIAATIIGYKGLTKWQAEMLGKRKTELAEEALASFYQFKDIMSSIRSPMASTDEGRSRRAGENETPQMKTKLDQRFTTLERYNQNIEFFATLNARRYRMKALFGPASDQAFKLKDEAIGQVISAAQMLLRRTAQEWQSYDPQLTNEWERAVWETGTVNDPVTIKIDEAIKLIEQLCSPILEGKA